MPDKLRDAARFVIEARDADACAALDKAIDGLELALSQPANAPSLEALSQIIEAARSGRCDDVVHGDTCGACAYCLAWKLEDDWREAFSPTLKAREPASRSGVKVDWSLAQEQAKQILKERAEEAE